MSNINDQSIILRTFDRRNRCINCSFLIPRNFRRLPLEQASNAVIRLLQSWITPTQVSPDCILCTECYELLQNRVNVNDQAISTLPAIGHRSICFPCGSSILRAQRTYPIRQNREETNILISLVPLHLISRMERVCAACMRAATRQVQRQQQQDANRPTVALNTDSAIPVPPPLPPPPNSIPIQVPQKVVSALYRRAANTSSRCVFNNCLEPERLLIPSVIKDSLLMNNKFYIPCGARVCRHHLSHGAWQELTSQLRDFTGSQFDTILTMMQWSANRRWD